MFDFVFHYLYSMCLHSMMTVTHFLAIFEFMISTLDMPNFDNRGCNGKVDCNELPKYRKQQR